MRTPALLPELIRRSAERAPQALALTHGEVGCTYSDLAVAVDRFAAALAALSLGRGERVAIYLEKRPEAVMASFGAAAAGAVFVPVNPLLKPEQVAFILRDCNVRVLVTSPERLPSLTAALDSCDELRFVLTTGGAVSPTGPEHCGLSKWQQFGWDELPDLPHAGAHRMIDADMAAIFYTSGSTGSPKGVVLSHRNLVAGAQSVASYLENSAQDTLLAALPLSFDAGFSQLTTAFLAGGRVVLLNYLLPRDVLKAMAAERVTGLTAVPPLYLQLARLEWPAEAVQNLRYFANTGGRLPTETLTLLRGKAPRAKPFLMYGLTEAFRSTYLQPSEVDRRPDSIGKAVPNAEVLVLRADGTPCAVEEPGELVHRGALVSMGYWNKPVQTAERFKLLPTDAPGRDLGLPLPEYAVFSGDTVRMDAEGFLYFVGRNDEMIKTSGYRVSPTEVEEVLYSTGLVTECAAFGVPHAVLGSAIQVVATKSISAGAEAHNSLIDQCRERLPAYMVPAGIALVDGALPRNPNGKIDRKRLSQQWSERGGAA